MDDSDSGTDDSEHLCFANLALGMRVESRRDGHYDLAIVKELDERGAMLFYPADSYDGWLYPGALYQRR